MCFHIHDFLWYLITIWLETEGIIFQGFTYNGAFSVLEKTLYFFVTASDISCFPKWKVSCECFFESWPIAVVLGKLGQYSFSRIPKLIVKLGFQILVIHAKSLFRLESCCYFNQIWTFCFQVEPLLYKTKVSAPSCSDYGFPSAPIKKSANLLGVFVLERVLGYMDMPELIDFINVGIHWFHKRHSKVARIDYVLISLKMVEESDC